MALQKNVIIDKQSSFHRWYETQLFLSNLNWKKNILRLVLFSELQKSIEKGLFWSTELFAI